MSHPPYQNHTNRRIANIPTSMVITEETSAMDMEFLIAQQGGYVTIHGLFGRATEIDWQQDRADILINDVLIRNIPLEHVELATPQEIAKHRLNKDVSDAE